MNDIQSPKTEGFKFSKLLTYFLQGLLVIAPVVITVYFVFWVVSSIDSQIPIFTAKDAEGKTYVQNYGLGFLIIIVAICLIGYLSSFFIKNKILAKINALYNQSLFVKFGHK